MHDILKYDETIDPQEHIIAYICAVKGNDMEPDEIESVLPKKIGETLTKSTMTWYSLIPEHSIKCFEYFAESLIQKHVEATNV